MLSKLEEIKLVSQCALGDNRRAFGRLVEAYQPRLRRFLMNLTMGDENLTDDLAQETFIKAYTGIRQFKGLSGFGTWLYRIAYNEFYSEKRRHHEEHVDYIAESMQGASTAAADCTEAQMDVQVAMKALNPVERTVITLFYIDDLPLKKIASITSLPEGTVKSSIFRAKEKMRQAIESRH
ncbi:MAG: sigma-70 family RNA polymerase sigma factor [Bacteroidales bacterium]|nr:sigma-70 family RNA polymerase sigma factor [Bacteroidales bacterium]